MAPPAMRTATATLVQFRKAFTLDGKDALADDHDMVNVELLGRQIVEGRRALPHELVQLLADGDLGVVARFQMVEADPGLEQLAQHVGNEGDPRQGVKRCQVCHRLQSAQVALRQKQRQRHEWQRDQ